MQVDGNAPYYVFGGLNQPSTVGSYTVLASGGKYAIGNKYLGSTWQSDASGAYNNSSRYSTLITNDTVKVGVSGSTGVTFNTLPCWFDPGYHMGGMETVTWQLQVGDTVNTYSQGLPLWDGGYVADGVFGAIRGGYARHAGQFFVAGLIGGRVSGQYTGPQDNAMLSGRYPPYEVIPFGGFYQTKFGSPASYFKCDGLTSHLTTRGYDPIYYTRIKTGVETWNFDETGRVGGLGDGGFGTHKVGNGPRLDTFCTMWARPVSGNFGIGPYQTTNTDGRASTTPLFCIGKGGSEGMALSIENDNLLPVSYDWASVGLSATTMYVPISALHKLEFRSAVNQLFPSPDDNLVAPWVPWSVSIPSSRFDVENWENWSSFESMIDFWRVIISPEHNTDIFDTYIKPHISFKRSNSSALWWSPSAGSHLVVRIANRPICISRQKIYGETWYNPAMSFKYTFTTTDGTENGDVFLSGGIDAHQPTWMSNLTGYNLRACLFNYGDLIEVSDKKMLSTLTYLSSHAGGFGFSQRGIYDPDTNFWDYYAQTKDSEVTIGRGVAGVVSPSFTPVGILADDIIGTAIDITGTSYLTAGYNTGPTVRVYTSAAIRNFVGLENLGHPWYFYIEHKDNPNIGEYFTTAVAEPNETVINGVNVTAFTIDPSKLNVGSTQTTFTYSYPEGSKVYVVDWYGGGNIIASNQCKWAPANTQIGEVYYGRSKSDILQPVSGTGVDAPVTVWSALFKQWYQYTHGLIIKPVTQYTSTYTVNGSASQEWDSAYFTEFDTTSANYDKNGYLRYGGHDHRQYNDTWTASNAYMKVPPNSALGY